MKKYIILSVIIIILSFIISINKAFCDDIKLTMLAPSTWVKVTASPTQDDLYASNTVNSSGTLLDGKVGIGTIAPAYKLDINGDVHATNYFTEDAGAPVSGADGDVTVVTGITPLTTTTLHFRKGIYTGNS